MFVKNNKYWNSKNACDKSKLAVFHNISPTVKHHKALQKCLKIEADI